MKRGRAAGVQRGSWQVREKSERREKRERAIRAFRGLAAHAERAAHAAVDSRTARFPSQIGVNSTLLSRFPRPS